MAVWVAAFRSWVSGLVWLLRLRLLRLTTMALVLLLLSSKETGRSMSKVLRGQGEGWEGLLLSSDSPVGFAGIEMTKPGLTCLSHREHHRHYSLLRRTLSQPTLLPRHALLSSPLTLRILPKSLLLHP